MGNPYEEKAVDRDLEEIRALCLHNMDGPKNYEAMINNVYNYLMDIRTRLDESTANESATGAALRQMVIDIYPEGLPDDDTMAPGKRAAIEKAFKRHDKAPKSKYVKG